MVGGAGRGLLPKQQTCPPPASVTRCLLFLQYMLQTSLYQSL